MPYFRQLADRLFAALLLLLGTATFAIAAGDVHVEKVVAYWLNVGTGQRLIVSVTMGKAPPADVGNVSHWRVRVAPLEGNGIPFVDAVGLRVDRVYSGLQRLVELSVDPPAACTECRVQVFFDGVFQPGTEASLKSGRSKPFYQAAKKKDDADIYFSGTMATSQDNEPNYSVDAVLGVSADAGAWGVFGGRSTFVVDKEPKLDPSSISVAAAWRKVIAVSAGAGLILRSDLFRGEFDREDQVRNGVTSLLVTMVTKRAYIDNHTYAGVDPVGGFEFGKNYRTISEEQASRIARLVVGFDVFYGIVRHGGADALTVEAQYRHRTLATAEPFVQVGAEAPIFNQDARHYFSMDATLAFTDYLGVTVAFRDGSLPPLYQSVRKKVSIGLTLKLRQRLRAVP